MKDDEVSVRFDMVIKIMNCVGTAMGQVFFDILSDVYGHEKVTLSLSINWSKVRHWAWLMVAVATLFLGVLADGFSINFIYLVLFERVVLRFGIGGILPNSSIITTKLSNTRYRGRITASIVCARWVGALVAAVNMGVCLLAFRESLNSGHCNSVCTLHIDTIWRIVCGIGGLPAFVIILFRFINCKPSNSKVVIDDVERLSSNDILLNWIEKNQQYKYSGRCQTKGYTNLLQKRIFGTSSGTIASSNDGRVSEFCWLQLAPGSFLRFHLSILCWRN